MKSLFLLLFTCSAALAAEPTATPDLTDKLLEVTHFENLAVDSAVAAFDGFTKQMVDQGMPASAISEIREEARKMYDRIFRSDDLKEKTKALYNKHFTEAEIEELVLFYQTPLGQKTLEVTPSIMAESMQMATAAIQNEMPTFQQKIAEIVEKHQQAETNPDEAPEESGD